MPSDNVEAVERAYKAFGEGDFEAALAMIHPDFEVVDHILPEGAPNLRGPEALVANAAQVRQVFGDIRWEPQEIGDLGERLLVRIRVEATADHTELAFGDEIAHVMQVEDGRVLRLEIFRTWDEGRAAAGLGD